MSVGVLKIFVFLIRDILGGDSGCSCLFLRILVFVIKICLCVIEEMFVFVIKTVRVWS